MPSVGFGRSFWHVFAKGSNAYKVSRRRKRTNEDTLRNCARRIGGKLCFANLGPRKKMRPSIQKLFSSFTRSVRSLTGHSSRATQPLWPHSSRRTRFWQNDTGPVYGRKAIEKYYAIRARRRIFIVARAFNVCYCFHCAWNSRLRYLPRNRAWLVGWGKRAKEEVTRVYSRDSRRLGY